MYTKKDRDFADTLDGALQALKVAELADDNVRTQQEVTMTMPKDEPAVDRGQLIYAMAVIDRQVDEIRKVLALPRMKDMRPAAVCLSTVCSSLAATKQTIYLAMKPRVR